MATEVQLPLKGWSGGIRLPFVLTFEHNSGEAAPTRPGDRPNANYYGQMEYGGRRGVWNILEMLEGPSWIRVAGGRDHQRVVPSYH